MTAAQAYPRFSRSQRLEHLVGLGSFTLLAVTGLPQMAAAAGWAQTFIGWLGGIGRVRALHHAAASVLMLEAVFHLAGLGYRLYVQRARPSMLLGRGDLREALGTLTYNLRLTTVRPPAGRYSFEEKVEYWAFVWGTAVMAVTGFMLLNPIATTRFLPGETIPAAKTVHGYEALLAVLAVAVWHLYAVHLRRFNKSMWTGQLSEEEMRADHPLELAALQAGEAGPRVSAADLKKRRWLYYPVTALATAGLLAGVFAFMTLERTAITTVLPRLKIEAQAQAYVPLTPTPRPFATLSPLPADLQPIWQGNVALLFARNCNVCHGGIEGLDYTSYASALKGGHDGPVILPGDVDHSKLIQKIADGTHPGKLSPEEFSVLQDWIAAGALEQ
jgi:cytochrome b subunit of formate dehydrogenase